MIERCTRFLINDEPLLCMIFFHYIHKDFLIQLSRPNNNPLKYDFDLKWWH